MNELSQVIATSLLVAIGATAAIIALGSPFAYALSRPTWRGRSILDALVNLPLLLPPSVVGYYLLWLLSPDGWIGAFLTTRNIASPIFTPVASIIAACVVSMPLYVQALRNSLASVDPDLLAAAVTDGAATSQSLLYIVFPLAKGGLLTGAVLAFARSMGEFGATLVVAGNIPGRTQTLGLAVYTAIQAGDDRLAHILALISLAIGTIATWIALRLREP